MFLPSYICNIPATVAATTATDKIDCERMTHVSFQVTQTAAGVSYAATIQASNDGTNWADTTTTATITGAGTVILERTGCCSRYYRLNLVKTTGSLTAVQVIASGLI